MKQIYVYQIGEDSLFWVIVNSIAGIKYTAMDGPIENGNLLCQGRTKVGTYRKAVRKLRRMSKNEPWRQTRLMAQWTEVGERVR